MLIDLGYIHRVDMGIADDVSGVHAVYIFRLEAYNQEVNLVYVSKT
jgi:hypothetical protein